ncbi:ABC transporter permease [Planctomonas psychrotolerans]|uniref:ABC transporter permease n=1 Tax=Planctomonas psychrotolerans TaxID=2528712 RepID=UPI00123AF77A|nr:ABC transporter permease [Planctomonas psychrotolerans]
MANSVLVASPQSLPGSRRRRRVGEKISRRTYAISSIGTFVVLFALWALVTLSGFVSPLFLPSPVAVAERLVTQIQNGQLASDAATSVYRIGAGFLLATVAAIPIGIGIGTSRRIEAALEPLVDFVRYMPVVAFVPLTILWVGIGDGQKFLIIFLGTFFQQVLLIADAVRQVPRPLIDLGETLGLSNAQILRRIVLRSAAPRIWDALRITLGWAWTWLVVAELVAATSGLGYRITLGQRYFQTDTIILYVIILGIFGLITDQVMRFIGRRVFRYERISR